jgi:signal transduction histidine kinase/CheY-like chemotaxis protein
LISYNLLAIKVHYIISRWWRFCLLALLSLCGTLPVALAAGPPQAFLRQFGPDEGLSQHFIYCLLQDRQGYLWLGTAEGLVRYDGTRFVTFTTRDGLADNFITALQEDAATGHLWVAHYQGARSVRPAAGGRFRTARADEQPAFHPPSGPPPIDTACLGRYRRHYSLGLPADVVPICLLEDREGNAWLGTAGQGLWRHADRYLTHWPGPAGLVLAAPAAAPAWATAAGQYYALPGATQSGAALQALPMGTVPGGTVRVVLARPAALGGGYWLGTTRGVWVVPAPGQSAAPVPGLGGSQDLGSAVTALTYAPSSGLWVGTEADGVYYLPNPKPGQPTLPRHFTTASGLLHNSTTALLADRSGRVWLAAPSTGLASWQPGQPHFTYYRLAAGGLDATALAEDADGTIWVGTEGQGLFYQRAGSPHWQHLQAPAALPSDYLVALRPLPTPLANRLLLVHPQGLSLLDTRRATATSLTAATNPLGQGGLPSTALVTHPPLAWVATRTGLLRLDLSALARQPTALMAIPGLAFSGAEVDGEARAPLALGELKPGQHRVSFNFQGISLAADGGGPLLYRYRLQGLANEWSRPSPAGEAQFAGLGPGRYVLQVQVRRPALGAAWSAPLASAFSIATPWWRQAWVQALGVLLALGLLALLVRAREGTLRRQKYQLEHTVRERTTELRQRQHHIERINAELLVARDAAEASRRAKAQFLANMSHEIRTPMNAVIGLTNLLRETNPTPEQQEYLGAIGSSSQNLLVILNDILDSSKMEAGKLTLEQAPFALPALVRGLGTMFRHAASSKGLALNIEVAAGVPTAVLGDSVRLQQVLVNLVSNALKFTRQGGVQVRVAPVPGAAPDAGHVALRFEVQDTGIGIPADKLTAIFEDFSQANTSTTREFGGTGLGLSIARNLVQLHGGQLTVRSEVGVGSTFSFELPYALADADLLLAPASTSGPLPPFAPILRVLVAEDNALNQLVARKTLENWHVHVTIADNGRLAVAQALASPEAFDAVLMDVQMPELDGYAATRQLREHFPDAARLPIIGLTASVLPEDRALALAVGMNDILAKPFEPATLHARLAYYTGRATGPAGAPSPPPPPAEPLPAPLPRPNWQQLEDLAGGNEQFIQQIISTFLEQAPALEQLLPEAYPHDLAILAQLAHKLKGQVAYFGVPGLHAQLDELERAARQPDCPYGAALIQSVRQQLAHLYPLLAERA